MEADRRSDRWILNVRSPTYLPQSNRTKKSIDAHAAERLSASALLENLQDNEFTNRAACHIHSVQFAPLIAPYSSVILSDSEESAVPLVKSKSKSRSFAIAQDDRQK